jgi:hypothetical protein
MRGDVALRPRIERIVPLDIERRISTSNGDAGPATISRQRWEDWITRPTAVPAVFAALAKLVRQALETAPQ